MATRGPHWVDFRLPQIVGDSLRGWQNRRVRSTVAIADVRNPEQYHFSGGRTTVLATVVFGVAWFVVELNKPWDLCSQGGCLGKW